MVLYYQCFLLALLDQLDQDLQAAQAELNDSIEGSGEEQASKSTLNTMLLVLIFVLLLIVLANQYAIIRRRSEERLPDVDLESTELEPVDVDDEEGD